MIHEEWLKPNNHFLWKNDVPSGNAFGIRRVRQPGDDANFTKHLHTHRDFAEIFWIESGQGTHIINGQESPLSPWDFVMVRPEDVHTTRAADGQNLIFVNITFPIKTLFFIKKRYFQQVPGFFDPKSRQPLQKHISGQLRKWMEEACLALFLGRKTRFDLEAFLLPLFHDLYFPPPKTRLETCPVWLQEAYKLIQKPEHFVSGIHQFEWLAGRSQEHVSRECKKWLGMTPTELVNQARLEYVASKLADSSVNISDIAHEAGFKNITHFYVLFGKYFHMTPRQYRQGKRFAAHNAPAQSQDETDDSHPGTAKIPKAAGGQGK